MEEGHARAVVKELATDWSIEIAPNLRGEFQLQNALNAVAATRWLQQRGYRITDEAIQELPTQVVGARPTYRKTASASGCIWMVRIILRRRESSRRF